MLISDSLHENKRADIPTKQNGTRKIMVNPISKRHPSQMMTFKRKKGIACTSISELADLEFSEIHEVAVEMEPGAIV